MSIDRFAPPETPPARPYTTSRSPPSTNKGIPKPLTTQGCRQSMSLAGVLPLAIRCRAPYLACWGKSFGQRHDWRWRG